MKAISRIALLASSTLMLACSPITFVQVDQPGEHKTHTRWHHATANGMVELSKPLDIQSICHEKAWTKITTEHTLANWAAEVIVPNPPFLVLYSAWTNKVQCHEASEQ